MLEPWIPAEAMAQVKDLPMGPLTRMPHFSSSVIYNGMIHPLRNFKIKGVVWYQGESNVSRADKYHKLFSTMIGQWREVFGYEFPFYFVQISPFNYRDVNAAYLRIITLAYNLFVALKILALPKAYKVLRLKTLLFRLLGVPALVTRHARRLWLQLPRGHPHAAAFQAAMR